MLRWDYGERVKLAAEGQVVACDACGRDVATEEARPVPTHTLDGDFVDCVPLCPRCWVLHERLRPPRCASGEGLVAAGPGALVGRTIGDPCRDRLQGAARGDANLDGRALVKTAV